MSADFFVVLYRKKYEEITLKTTCDWLINYKFRTVSIELDYF